MYYNKLYYYTAVMHDNQVYVLFMISRVWGWAGESHHKTAIALHCCLLLVPDFGFFCIALRWIASIFC